MSERSSEWQFAAPPGLTVLPSASTEGHDIPWNFTYGTDALTQHWLGGIQAGRHGQGQVRLQCPGWMDTSPVTHPSHPGAVQALPKAWTSLGMMC